MLHRKTLSKKANNKTKLGTITELTFTLLSTGLLEILKHKLLQLKMFDIYRDLSYL